MGSIHLFMSRSVLFLLLCIWSVALTKVAAHAASEAQRLIAAHQGEAAVDGMARRILSVGDLHGDYEHASELLQSLGLMDSAGSWTGGNDVLVQTGDIIDRGDHSNAIYQMLFRLQDEAAAKGGEVILLLGNHELMHMQGQDSYLSEKDAEEFGGSKECDAAFEQSGWLGKRLRERGQVAALLGSQYGLSKPVIFVHGGLLPATIEQFGSAATGPGKAFLQQDRLTAGAKMVQSINEAARAELMQKNEEQLSSDPSPLFGDSGPLWTRHLSNEDSGCEDLHRTLSLLGASRMVVGHTPQADGRVHPRCDGGLLLADTMISKAFDGESHQSAVQFMSDGQVFALYPQRTPSKEALDLQS